MRSAEEAVQLPATSSQFLLRFKTFFEMAKVVFTALFASAVAALSPSEVLEGLRQASHDERIHAPVIDVSSISPGVRRAGLKSYSTILMHGLGDAGHNPGMHSLAVVRIRVLV